MRGLWHNLWLIPALPLLTAGITSLLKQPRRKAAATLAIGSMAVSFLLSCLAFAGTLGGEAARHIHNFAWFQMGSASLQLGWMLDPLTAVMLVMVTFVGLLIFIYSVGYMAHDENFTRFFCFLSLFAAAMLGLVIANSLLLLFICWELVGFASYILIGFWYQKPSAAAAAKKAFITTRIGDIGLFLGMLWLYKETGTLLFYDNGQGCLEQSALTKLVGQTIGGGMAVSTAISLLIFCGAIGKSGQVPLHVWLPDAMEGPTPVSALIHAATMVAAGVFLVARMFPLMSTGPTMETGGTPVPLTTALAVVTWLGAITSTFAALIAVAQTDIKRILAYSTVSQLGFMFVGLGVGGVAVGMFHLITHAFFKALLFLGAGSVIHGCHEEQDIRRMGGLRKFMPVTFATYAVGMMALSGFPLLFSGFWSKDDILHSAWQWPVSKGPFVLAAFGALLTAFYMTRQMCYVFFGESRTGFQPIPAEHGNDRVGQPGSLSYVTPHESPPVMTLPLVILAVFAVLLGFLGTPAWPWFQSFLNGENAHFGLAHLSHALPTMLLSTLIAAVGVGLGWRLYGAKPIESAEQRDILQEKQPTLFRWLRDKFYVDELYERTVIALNADWARLCDFFDRWVWGGAVKLVSLAAQGFSDLSKLLDEFVVNGGFDASCRRVTGGGKLMSALQDGQVQNYLRAVALAVVALVLALLWGCK
ncbi:MAG: NADH-quinone oxidoreductase subunit L [Verrucomicrobia bacterium]|nr:NADH-quinone oxidoreductase subunit L [Verrucomicrobiota bacterium]